MGKNKTPIDRNMTRARAIAQGGYYNTDGDWNNIITRDDYPDKIFRGRVEVLVFKGTKVYMVRKNDGYYRIPGGGFDKGVSNKDQVFMETKEEARILVKNIRFTGVTYVKLFNTEFDVVGEKDIPYDGSVNEVYIADYDKDYDGYIKRELRDNELTNKGDFYELNEIKDILSPAHKQAIENMLQTKPISESTEEDHERYDKCVQLCKSMQNKIRELHNNGKCKCIYNRDIETDDGQIQFAWYNINDESDIEDIKSFYDYLYDECILNNLSIDFPVTFKGYGPISIY